MIVVITNKLKEIIDSSRLKEANCKYAVGFYTVNDCIQSLSSLDIDYLVIDITAFKDAFEISSWKRVKDFIDPSKTVILLEEAKSYSNVGFLSMLITMGFYNFTKTGEGITRLMERPNSYQEVAKYQKMAMNLEDRKEEEEERFNDYQRKLGENQDMMRDYLERYQKGEVSFKRKNDVFKYQLKVGLLALPILTIASVFFIYLFQIFISNMVPLEDSVGEYLYTELAHTGFTPLTIIGILIITVFFSIYYTFLNAKIKRMQMTRSKFIIIPFAIFCVLVFGEYYLVGVLEKFYEFIKIIPIDDKMYLCQDLYWLSRYVATAAIFLFYISTFIDNSRTLKFEKDLGQKLTWLEKLWVIDMILLLMIPLACQLSLALPESSSLSSFFSSISDKSLIMMVIAGIEFILTILILLQPKFVKEKEYTILKEEDL